MSESSFQNCKSLRSAVQDRSIFCAVALLEEEFGQHGGQDEERQQSGRDAGSRLGFGCGFVCSFHS